MLFAFLAAGEKCEQRDMCNRTRYALRGVESALRAYDYFSERSSLCSNYSVI